MEDSGRVAIVTGGTRGIGLAIAEALVARGDRVAITGRDPETLAKAVADLGTDQAIGFAGKAHDEAHQEEVVAGVIDAFGRIDYLVNNVGTNPVFGPVIEQSADLFRKILDINVVSAFGWIQRAHRAWMAEHGGAVVNVSSVGGIRPAPGIGIYGMSKAALSYLTAQLGVELGPKVRVNAVAPAVVKTKLAAALFEGKEDKVLAGYPAGRLGEPADIAAAVAFLLSDQASWITGETLVIDGGSSLVGSVR